MMSRDAIKKAVGYRAAEFIQDGMRVGLGTGSTAHYFIEKLIERCRDGLKIEAAASSQSSLLLAKRGGIPLCDIDHIPFLDVTVDGADEVDPQKRMIKGAGGAHVREKILASMSRELIIIVDESKLVPHLGKAKLPVEILPFAMTATLHHIRKLGVAAELRQTAPGKGGQEEYFRSDNGNWIVDIHLAYPCAEPEQIDKRLRQIPGVVDTGFFFHLAGRVVIGFADGQIVLNS